MFDSRDQLRSFFLAGTVPIPSPFPSLGKISLELRAGDVKQEPGDLALDAVRIVHQQSPRVLIARTVLLDDVQAVFIPDRPGSVDLVLGTWCFRPDIRRRLIALVAENVKTKGIVYVPEAARVYMEVGVGMTAAESAEYYPPLARERNDAHYRLGGSRENDREIRCPC